MFEYLIRTINSTEEGLQDYLNRKGYFGWELVTINRKEYSNGDIATYFVVFKRIKK